MNGKEYEKLVKLNNLLYGRYEDIYVELWMIIDQEEKEEIKQDQLKKIENVLGMSIFKIRELINERVENK